MTTIYHGSKNNFKEFSFNKIRTNATSEGVGFYCTDKKSIAERYGNNGYLLEYKFVGKKELSSKKVTLTKDKLKKYLIALHEEDSFLDNYGDVSWEGFEKVLNRAIKSLLEYSKDDVEIVSGICNAYGDFEMPLKILHKLFRYDHSLVKATWGENQTIYLILNQSAIKFVKSTSLK